MPCAVPVIIYLSAGKRKMLNRTKWKNLWLRLGGKSNHGSTFDLIERSYMEPHRFYHNDKHINDCLDIFDKVSSLSTDTDLLEASIWFHDIIYDTHSGDNEEKSAERADALLKDGGISSAVCLKIYDLIMQTKIENEPDEINAKLIRDIDLSVFAKPVREYDLYEKNVRKEFAWVNEDKFWFARKNILKSFLNRNTIYCTEYFQERYEEKARKNLLRVIDKL